MDSQFWLKAAIGPNETVGAIHIRTAVEAFVGTLLEDFCLREQEENDTTEEGDCRPSAISPKLARDILTRIKALAHRAQYYLSGRDDYLREIVAPDWRIRPPLSLQFGSDLYLTAAGHGAGFWDGDWQEDVGRMLTEDTKAVFGYSFDIYRGDDGLLYSE